MKSFPILIAMLGLSGCFQSDRNLGPSVETGETGKARIVVHTGKVGALAKTSGSRDINLATLEVTLSAPGEDDLSESFPLSGNSASTVSHTFTDLASLKTWTLTAVSKDGTDSAIHRGSTSFEVRPRQIANVNLDLSPLFSMLKTRLFPVRDSTTRCELWVDGVKRDDSSFAKQSALGDTIPLAFDYISTGVSHTIKLDVYGESWGFDTLLYSEDTILNIAAGEDASHSMLLKWVGPALPPPGQASMTVALGAIGNVKVDGTLEDTASLVNLALNPSRTGYPSPLASDDGWGAGTDKWDLVDGNWYYPNWTEGLALNSGGDFRQITIEFSGPETMSEATLWHHRDCCLVGNNIPENTALHYFDGTDWQPIAFTRTYDLSIEPPAGQAGAYPDRYRFSTPVTGSRFRWSYNGNGPNILGQTGGWHGWVYQVDVMGQGH